MTSSVSSYLASQSAPTTSLSGNGGASGSGTAGDLASGASSLSTSYQTFLTLLTTQLQNQDPSSPMDPNQFTTELVQMTGVQQQLLSNQLLQTLVNDQPASGVSSAVSLIGKQATATGATTSLANGQASWSYSLPQAAAKASVTVSNSAGQVVYTGSAPSLAAGSSTFTWNGQTNGGTQAPDGAYTLSVAATDLSGGTLTPTLSVSGVVSSVQSVNGTTMLTLGSTQVPVSSLTNVSGS